jgi:hypothetical protein
MAWEKVHVQKGERGVGFSAVPLSVKGKRNWLCARLFGCSSLFPRVHVVVMLDRHQPEKGSGLGHSKGRHEPRCSLDTHYQSQTYCGFVKPPPSSSIKTLIYSNIFNYIPS